MGRGTFINTSTAHCGSDILNSLKIIGRADERLVEKLRRRLRSYSPSLRLQAIVIILESDTWCQSGLRSVEECCSTNIKVHGSTPSPAIYLGHVIW